MAHIVMTTGVGVIAVSTGANVTLAGSGGVKFALGQTSEIKVQEALSATASQRA